MSSEKRKAAENHRLIRDQMAASSLRGAAFLACREQSRATHPVVVHHSVVFICCDNLITVLSGLRRKAKATSSFSKCLFFVAHARLSQCNTV